MSSGFAIGSPTQKLGSGPAIRKIPARPETFFNKRSDLNAEIEEGAISSTLVHLANISYRLGRTINFDPATLTCKNDAEANRMMTRDDRAPFVVPEKI